MSGTKLASQLQIVTIAPGTLFYKMFAENNSVVQPNICRNKTKQQCRDSPNNSKIPQMPTFVSFTPYFEYGDWACIFKSNQPLKLMVMNRPNWEILMKHLSLTQQQQVLLADTKIKEAINAEKVVQGLEERDKFQWYEVSKAWRARWERNIRSEELRKAQAVYATAVSDASAAETIARALWPVINICSKKVYYQDLPVQAPVDWNKKAYDFGITPPSKPSGWDAAADGDFFQQDLLAPETMRNSPLWVRDSTREDDAICFAGIQQHLTQLGVDGIWSPTKTHFQGQWGQYDQAGQWVRLKWPEEAVIYNCRAIDVISQVPLRAIHNLIQSIDARKPDPNITAYLARECCAPSRVLEFINQTQDQQLKTLLIQLHALLTRPNVTLPSSFLTDSDRQGSKTTAGCRRSHSKKKAQLKPTSRKRKHSKKGKQPKRKSCKNKHSSRSRTRH